AQQFLHLGAKLHVAGTGLLQKARPLLRRVLLNRLQKDRFHLVGPLAHALRSRGTDTALHTNADFACCFSHGGRNEMKKNHPTLSSPRGVGRVRGGLTTRRFPEVDCGARRERTSSACTPLRWICRGLSRPPQRSSRRNSVARQAVPPPNPRGPAWP